MSAFAASRHSWLSQALHNKIVALVLAMIVAVPLFAAPADNSLTGIAALTLEAFAVILATVLLWRSQWDLRAENLKAFVKTGANVPVLLFVAWVALSAALSTHVIYSVQYLLQIAAGVLLYFTVGYHFRQSKHLSLLAGTIVFLGAVAALGGLAQYQIQGDGRARALFGDPQPLGSFVMLLLPVVAALAFTDKNARRQVAAQITSVLMVGCLLLTHGRSAWIGGIVGLVAFVVLSSRVVERKEKSSLSLAARKHQMVLPAMLSIATLGFVLLMGLQNREVVGRASTLTNLTTDASFQGRIQTHWAGAWQMVQERPLTGWGAGQFPLYQKQFTEAGANIAPGGLGTRVSLTENAHSFYLQTTAELGLIGLVLLVGALVCFWVAGWKQIRKMDAGIRRTLLIGSLAATAGFAVDAVSSPSWHYAQNSMFLWLMLGMGTSCLRPRLRREEEVDVPAPAVRRVAWVTRPAAVAACLSLTTLLPSAHVAAQSFGYNPTPGNPDLGAGRDNNDYERILIGVGVVTALFYLFDAIGDNNKNVPAGAGGSNRNQQNNGRGPNPGPGNSGNAPAGGPR